MRVLVTGGAGFIGSALVRHLIADSDHDVLNYDALTYAAAAGSLDAVAGHPRYRFVRGDVADAPRVAETLAGFRPQVVVHLAAETHVDRSLDGPAAFVRTNIVGTFTLLEQALAHVRTLPAEEAAAFRFHHVSTDEVFGSLGDDGRFDEATPYDPRSPYSASKAASDHLVRAWGHSYGLPVLVTNCSNNYGPYHFPEKLVPLIVIRALTGRDLPVYGDGGNVRDWLFVDDHARALRRVFEAGEPGRTYAIGGDAEARNIDLVRAICGSLDRMAPRADGHPHADAIRFVPDRPGHDRRYAIDATRIRATLGWEPRETLERGIDRTVRWYLDNEGWWRAILDRTDATARIGAPRP